MLVRWDDYWYTLAARRNAPPRANHGGKELLRRGSAAGRPAWDSWRGRPGRRPRAAADSAPLLLVHASVQPLLEGGGADVSVGVAQVELGGNLGSNLV
jgi:hypothetical protein